MIQFCRYQGSKRHFVEKFNNLIINTKASRYIEPFVGSGAILFNLEREFDEYIINDVSKPVISIYYAFRDLSYDDYLNALDLTFQKFGDIKSDKDAYYKFRNWYNKEYHFTDKVEKGLFLHILANSCINSMLRFGPNGMNQSFGKRLYTISESDFNSVKIKLQKTVILNKDYKEVIKDSLDSLIFLDPPYFERPTSYSNNFLENDLLEFLNTINHIKKGNEIIYTDIYNNDTKKFINLPFIETKMIRNTSPNSRVGTHQEVAYYNF